MGDTDDGWRMTDGGRDDGQDDRRQTRRPGQPRRWMTDNHDGHANGQLGRQGRQG